MPRWKYARNDRPGKSDEEPLLSHRVKPGTFSRTASNEQAEVSQVKNGKSLFQTVYSVGRRQRGLKEIIMINSKTMK